MLNNIGIWASSKGMVKVPDLSTLTNTEAIAAINAAGLTYSGSSSTDTATSSLNNKVASQIPNANELVDYESSVSFIYYSYVPAPAPVGVSPVGVSPVGVSPVGVSPVGVTPSTTWYCSAIERVSGSDYTRQFTATTDNSGVQCDVQTIVCSQSAYPAYPSITACSVTPVGVSPVGVSPVGATGSLSLSISIGSGNSYTLNWSMSGPSQVSYRVFFNGAGSYIETGSGTTGSSESGTVTGTTGNTVYWYVQAVGSDGFTYNSNTVSLTIVDTSVSPVGVSPVGVSPVPASEWYCSELSFLGQSRSITTYNASAETCDQFKRVCWEVPPNTGYPPYPTSYPTCSVTPVGVTPVGVTPVGVTPVGVSPASPCPAGQEPFYGGICNCAPYCGLPFSCGTQGACEFMAEGAQCLIGCI